MPDSSPPYTPVCLGCWRERYPDWELDREWPTTPKTCHACGMTTEMGYSLRPVLADSAMTSTAPPELST